MFTNNTLAMNAVFAAIQNDEEVVFGAGSYYIDDTITIRNWCKIRTTALSNALFTGNIFFGGSGKVCFDIETEVINIIDLGFRSVSSDGNTAITLHRTSSGGTVLENINDCRLTRIWIASFSTGISNTSGFQGNHINNCTIEGCSVVGMQFINDPSITNYSFANNIISNNRFFVNLLDIKVDGDFTSFGASAQFGNIISNNIFDRGDGTVTSIDLGAGMVTTDISNNSFSECSSNAIRATGQLCLNISGNTYTKIGKDAINLTDCDQLVINGEVINQSNRRKDESLNGLPPHSLSLPAITLDNCNGTVDVRTFSEASFLKNNYVIDCTNGSDVSIGDMNGQSFTVKPYNNSSSVVRAHLSGTFTPKVGASSVDGSHTYSNQIGTFTLDGETLTIDVRVTLTAKDGAMAGTVQMKGLPTIEPSGSGILAQESILAGYARTLTFSKNTVAYLKTFNLDFVVLREWDSSGFSDLTSTAIQATTTISFTGSYVV